MTDRELTRLYLRRAGAFLEAAKRVVHGKPDHRDRLHAPSLLLVGFGYEILFKSALLAAGTPEKGLRSFEHNLKMMWKDGRLKAMRAHVQNDQQVTSRLEILSDFHSRASNFTTRYPNTTPTLEAEIDPLIETLEKLIEFQDNP